jgi:hypothetical protein
MNRTDQDRTSPGHTLSSKKALVPALPACEQVGSPR